MLKSIKNDIPAGIVVFLVALPLCLGIALASEAPAFSGIISGIVGGIVVGLISGSNLSVSGPAAGLTAIVASSLESLSSFELFLAAVVIAGIIQLLLGALKAGIFGNYIPSSVIKGMLAAIGAILLFKQIPHALGYDEDFEGDESFIQPDGHNTFSELLYSFNNFNTGAIIITLVGIGILVLWERPALKKNILSTIFSGALLVVLAGSFLNELFLGWENGWGAEGKHLVKLPSFSSAGEFFSSLSHPDFSQLFQNTEIWTIAFTLAAVASIESLLSLEASDQLDPEKRTSPPNRELVAQGIGNIVSGFLGGLPITAVIVRSSANIGAGAKSKLSAVFHGFLLLFCVLAIPELLNKIPKSALAAILIMVGYKLTKISLFAEMFKKGRSQFVPFVVTFVAILYTDLLIGIIIGIITGLYFVIKNNFHEAVSLTKHNNSYLIKMHRDVSFLNKPLIRRLLSEIPSGANVLIDGKNALFIDTDIQEEINEFIKTAPEKGISVETKNLKSL